MATEIMMRNPQTGVTKVGLVGFSWTTFFLGGFPAIFRGDIVIGLAVIILGFFTFGLSYLIWAFIYNKHYTIKLLEKGYVFDDNENRVNYAKSKLGIKGPHTEKP